jgi:hypothetical protein
VLAYMYHALNGDPVVFGDGGVRYELKGSNVLIEMEHTIALYIAYMYHALNGKPAGFWEDNVRYELECSGVLIEMERFLIACPTWFNGSIQVHQGQELHLCWLLLCCPITQERGQASTTEELSSLLPQCERHKPSHPQSASSLQHLIHRNTPLAQIRLGQFDLFEKFLVRFRCVFESVDAVAKFAQEVGAERYEGPEGKLQGNV